MIDKIFKDSINKIIKEINKDENKYVIKNDILNPLLYQIKIYFYPYLLLIILYCIIILIINLMLIILIIKKNK